MTRWLAVVEGDIEPYLEGPFKNDQARVAAARKHRASDPKKRDGLFRLDVSNSGSPRMRPFGSREVSPEEPGLASISAPAAR